jgi:hypothetical protein
VRFRIDGYDGPPSPHDQPHSKAPAALLDRDQCVEILKLVHDGLGRTMACIQLGLSVRSMERTISLRPSFRRALAQVEQVRADNLYSVLYAAALDGDTQAAKFLLARHSPR